MGSEHTLELRPPCTAVVYVELNVVHIMYTWSFNFCRLPTASDLAELPWMGINSETRNIIYYTNKIVFENCVDKCNILC